MSNDDEYRARRAQDRTAGLLGQVLGGFISSILVTSVGAGIVTWAGHRELTSRVIALESNHERDHAQSLRTIQSLSESTEKSIDSVEDEIHRVEQLWRGCSERVTRAEQGVEFLRQIGP